MSAKQYAPGPRPLSGYQRHRISTVILSLSAVTFVGSLLAGPWITGVAQPALAATGDITTFNDLAANVGGPEGIVTGADGALRFTNDNDNHRGRLTTAGIFSTSLTRRTTCSGPRG